jgi:carbon storage regulator
MLVLTRRVGQSIRIGPGIDVRVVRIEGDRVVLGIAAPRHVAVVRSELIEQVSDEIREAADTRAKLRVMLAPVRPAPVPAQKEGHPARLHEPLYSEAPEPLGDPEDPDIA